MLAWRRPRAPAMEPSVSVDRLVWAFPDRRVQRMGRTAGVNLPAAVRRQVTVREITGQRLDRRGIGDRSE